MGLTRDCKKALFDVRNLEDLTSLHDDLVVEKWSKQDLKREETEVMLRSFYQNNKGKFQDVIGYTLQKDPKIVYAPYRNVSCMRTLFQLTYPLNVITPLVMGTTAGIIGGPAAGIQGVGLSAGFMALLSLGVSQNFTTDKIVPYNFKRIVVTSQQPSEAKIELFHDLMHYARKESGNFKRFHRFIEDGLAHAVSHKTVEGVYDARRAATFLNKTALTLTIKKIAKKEGIKEGLVSKKEAIICGRVSDYGGLSAMLLSEHRNGEGVYQNLFKGDYTSLIV